MSHQRVPSISFSDTSGRGDAQSSADPTSDARDRLSPGSTARYRSSSAGDEKYTLSSRPMNPTANIYTPFGDQAHTWGVPIVPTVPTGPKRPTSANSMPSTWDKPIPGLGSPVAPKDPYQDAEDTAEFWGERVASGSLDMDDCQKLIRLWDAVSRGCGKDAEKLVSGFTDVLKSINSKTALKVVDQIASIVTATLKRIDPDYDPAAWLEKDKPTGLTLADLSEQMSRLQESIDTQNVRANFDEQLTMAWTSLRAALSELASIKLQLDEARQLNDELLSKNACASSSIDTAPTVTDQRTQGETRRDGQVQSEVGDQIRDSPETGDTRPSTPGSEEEDPTVTDILYNGFFSSPLFT